MISLLSNRFIEAVTRQRSGKAPEPKQPSPLPQQPAQIEIDSRLKFHAGDIVEHIFASNALAQWVLTDDLQTCLVCGASGSNMLEADAHLPLCKVARVWNAIDRFGITKAEVR